MKMKFQDYSELDSLSLYEEIRRDLMNQNFVIQLFTKELNKRVRRLENTKSKLRSIKQIERIEKITNGLYQQVYLGKNAVIVGSTPLEIEERGIYFRFSPEMTLQDWIESYYKAKLLSEKEKNYKVKIKSKKRSQIGMKDIDKNIWLYLKIEKLLPKFWREKVFTPQIDFATDETVKIPVVEGAIEYLLASEGVEDAKKVEKMKKKYKDIYYRVARRYSLPTYRDLPQYLKLLDEVAS